MQVPSSPLISKKRLLYLVVVLFILFFTNLNLLRPNIMEARNFVTAREMVEKDNWLLPTLNGAPRYAKPPLPTWVTAGMTKLTGDVHWVAPLRIPAAAIAVVGLAFMFLLVRRMTDNEDLAFFTTLILATSFYYNYLGKISTWDIYCHGFMLAAIYSLYLGLKRKLSSFRYFALAGVFFALSFMSKGPISFYTVLVPFLVAYIITNSIGEFKTRKSLIGIAATGVITILIAGAWPLYTYLQDSETLLSITSYEVQQWSERHIRPFWYYLNFPVQAGAWALIIIPALIYPYMKTRVSNLRNYKFALFWFLAALILLSVVPEKKDRYLMPALIPLAFVVSFYVEYLIKVLKAKSASRFDRLSYYINLSIFGTASLAAPVLYYLFGYKTNIYGMPMLVLISALYFALAGYLLGGFRNRDGRKLLWGVVGTVCLLNLFGLSMVSDYQLTNPIYKSIDEVRSNPEVRDLYFATTGEINPIYVWEAGQEVVDINLQLDQINQLAPFALLTLAKKNDLQARQEFSSVTLEHIDTFYPGLKPEPEYFLYVVRNR